MHRSNTTPAAVFRALCLVLFAMMIVSVLLNSSIAQAAPSDYRFAAAGDKFEDTWQFAVAYRLPPRLRADRLELAVGTFATSDEFRPFVSFGPVWRWPFRNDSMFVEFGISPTLLSGSTFNGRDLGGNFHFTSAAAIGKTFGARDAVSVSLRIQHTSNGSLRSTNPGLDMIGLNFAIDFSRR